MSDNIDQLILNNLITNSEFSKKVFPFIKSEYFIDYSDKIVFNHIHEFITKYKTQPTKEALLIAISNDKNIDEEIYKKIKDIVSNFTKSESDLGWLVEVTENFCRDKSIYNAVSKTIKIFQGEDKNCEVGEIPKLLSDAISVTFDSHIGHSYIEDSDDRFKFYHKKEERIPFDLTYMNKITGGGLIRKTLNVLIA